MGRTFEKQLLLSCRQRDEGLRSLRKAEAVSEMVLLIKREMSAKAQLEMDVISVEEIEEYLTTRKERENKQ